MSVKRLRNMRGDTIVEVMFAVTIIGFVIGISYSLATKAVNAGRYAQEQTEALKVAESELERLKYIAGLGLTSGNDNIFDTTAGSNVFCINETYDTENAIYHKVPKSNNIDFATACKGRGVSKLYDIQVTYTANVPSGGNDQFDVAISWDRIGTSVPGNVHIVYRLHNASVTP